jgi:hypothetical protein
LPWRNVGLQDSYHIGAVRVHPKNPDIVYVAALGHLFGPNLAMDPANPRVLYATFWEVSRNPWHFSSGGPGSGLFKSTDGGDTWTDISRNPGLPRGVLGRIGVTVSPANPERVWALVEAANGGVFRSDNGGQAFTTTFPNRINSLV